ncbi:hypothetical protein PVAP13_5KG466100 [Panicum virgatum]|uniref:Uncharacterized protein n=1 Tax=Panicum virgatum TaxID=38727 RepID=A0A8T0SSB6_PANVG|nr:hypothetical protein PVAP13_5KG466100 [Panicum virgatum]
MGQSWPSNRPSCDLRHPPDLPRLPLASKLPSSPLPDGSAARSRSLPPPPPRPYDPTLPRQAVASSPFCHSFPSSTPLFCWRLLQSNWFSFPQTLGFGFPLFLPFQISAYCAGVPLMLDGCDRVIQFYVPYLPAIQLYGDSAVLRTPTSTTQEVGRTTMLLEMANVIP